jgi:hypothetical protein
VLHSVSSRFNVAMTTDSSGRSPGAGTDHLALEAVRLSSTSSLRTLAEKPQMLIYSRTAWHERQ